MKDQVKFFAVATGVILLGFAIVAGMGFAAAWLILLAGGGETPAMIVGVVVMLASAGAAGATAAEFD